MNIGVDGGALCAGQAGRFGTYRYTEELITALGQCGSPEHSYTVYHFCNNDHHELISDRVRFKQIRPATAWMQVGIPLQLAFQKPELFLGLNQVAPWGFSGKKIIISHGLSFLSFPDDYKDGIGRLKAQSDRFMKDADKVIVSSERISGELRAHYPDSTVPVIALPFGAPRDFAGTRKQGKNDNLKRDYLLYVGSGQPVKNLDGLLKIYTRFRINYPDIKLRLIGPDPRSFSETIPEGVRIEPPVEPSELKERYFGAMGYVTMSRYESFNFPVVEALCMGCPVIATTTAVIPEQLPFVVSCENEEEFLAGLNRLAEGKISRGDAAAVAEAFSWKRYVEELEKLYIM